MYRRERDLFHFLLFVTFGLPGRSDIESDPAMVGPDQFFTSEAERYRDRGRCFLIGDFRRRVRGVHVSCTGPECKPILAPDTSKLEGSSFWLDTSVR
jgi:hypothetical protein